MSANVFPEQRKVKFYAQNYDRLQGLRAIPYGVLMVGVGLWVNVQRGPARNFLAPAVLAVLSALAYRWIDRYYRRSFGRSVPSTRSKRIDLMVSILGGILGLAAFLADITFHLPFSMIGLLFAAAIFSEYARMVVTTRYWYAPFLPLFGAVILFFSFLPLLGFTGWWQTLGVRAEMVAILMVVGVIYIAYGLLSHLYFARSLPGEGYHGGSI